MIRLPTAIAMTLGAALTVSALGACSSDDASSNAAVSDAGPGDTVVGEGSAQPPTRLPSYVVPGTEAMAAITIDKTTGEFFVDSAESGKIYRGMAGANEESTLELVADLTSAGVSRGGHIALSPDGKTLYVLSGLGDAPRVAIVDLAAKAISRTVAMPASEAGPFTALQDVAVSPDGKTLYATNPLANVIHTVDLVTHTASTFPLSGDFPFVSNTSQGFLNATGLTVTNDGKYLLVVHVIDKHVYRVSLDPSSLGDAKKVDTAQYNVSGNGLWLGPDNEALEVAGDELRIFRFKMNADYTKGDYQTKYQGDVFEQGVSYAVAHGDRVLVLNGSGLSFANGGGFPGGGLPEGGALPEGGGFPPPGMDAGSKKLPIKVLQLPK